MIKCRNKSWTCFKIDIEIKKLSKSYFNTSALKINLNLIKNESNRTFRSKWCWKNYSIENFNRLHLVNGVGMSTIDGFDLKKTSKKYKLKLVIYQKIILYIQKCLLREYLMYVGQLVQIKNPNIEEVIEKNRFIWLNQKKLTFYLKV